MSQNPQQVCGEGLSRRLNERFKRLERRSDLDSGPLSGRTDFGNRFDERLKRLASMVSFKEMSAFARLPNARSFSPWSMGGWGLANDLTYLHWMPNLPQEEEEEQTSFLSSSSKEYVPARRSQSPWFSTPHRPASVQRGVYVQRVPSTAPVGKSASTTRYVPAKRGQATPSLARLRNPDPVAWDDLHSISEGQTHRSAARSGAKAKNAPQRVKRTQLDRVHMRAAKVLEAQQRKRQLSHSLPPSIAKSFDSQLARQASNRAGKTRSSSPLVRMLQPIAQAEYADKQLAPMALASQRQRRPGREIRGLRPVMSSSPTMQSLQVGYERQESSSHADLTIPKTGIRRLLEPSAGTAVAEATRPRPPKEMGVSSLPKEMGVSSLPKEMRASSLPKETGVRSRSESVLEQSLKANQTLKRSQAPKEKRPVATPNTRPMETLVQKMAYIQQPDQSLVPPVSGLSQRSKAKQAVPSEWNQEQIGDLLWDQSRDNKLSAATRLAPTEYIAQRQELTEQLSSSVLPFTTPGKRVEERVLSELVQRMAAVERDPTSDAYEALTELVQSAEQKILSTRRMRSYAPQSVDLLPLEKAESDVSPSERDRGIERSVPSPWFTRANAPSLTPQRTQNTPVKTSNLSPVQRASSRTVEPRTNNPTRPKAITLGSSISIEQIKRVLKSIQRGEPVNRRRGVVPDSKVTTSRKRPSLLRYIRPDDPEAVSQAMNEIVARSSRPARTISGTVPSESVAQDDKAQSSELLQRREQSADTRTQRLSEAVVARSSASTIARRSEEKRSTGMEQRPIETLWNRAITPQYAPEWISMGTGGRSPSSSPRGWRLGTRSYPMSAPEGQFLSFEKTDLPPKMDPIQGGKESFADVKSPWFTRQEQRSSLPQLSTSDVAGYGPSKRVPLPWEQVVGKKAVWLEKNKTVLLEGGTIVHAKVAEQLGVKPKVASGNKQRLPLQWTLEGVTLQSNHESLPSWAKRASEEPQIKSSSDFLQALAKASSTEDVVRVIFDRSDRDIPQMKRLPNTATQVIEQIRKEAHRVETERQMSGERPRSVAQARLSSSGRPQRRRRTTVVNNFTGLKPLSTARIEERPESDAKVTKLAKRLEDLILLAENNRQQEARQGVRMAEDSAEAIDEGQAGAKAKEERDYSLDIDALRQEVLTAFEQELSLRKIRSFDESNNQDIWW